MKIFLKTFDHFLKGLPKAVLILSLVVIVAFIGALDYLTGYQIRVTVFYVIPIFFASWYIGGAAGFAAAVLCAAGWPIKNFLIDHVAYDSFVLYWNASSKLGALLTISLLINLLVDRKRKEELLKRQTAELTRINEELDQFSLIVSHDLQSPLRLVVSYLQLLEQKSKNKLDSEQTDFVAHAVKAAHRMQKLIFDLREYSHIGKKENHYKPVDCKTVLDRALANLKILIDENKAKVTVSNLPAVIGVESELARLFQNLIENAIKYKGEQNLEIRISARSLGEEWLFSFQDNGIGIDSEHFERIFQIFQRLHAEERFGGGTGVGLALCKKIVDLHGGRIWVESQLGEGSSFFFTISKKIFPKKTARENTHESFEKNY